MYDNFSVSDIYTDESSSGSSGAHDLEVQMEEVERFAINTAMLSEASTILDSGATDKNNNNNDFWTPTPTKEDAVVISDEEEEEGNGCEWGSSYFFSSLTVCTNDQNCLLLLQQFLAVHEKLPTFYRD